MKILTIFILLSGGMLAADGYDVYKKRCQQCHLEIMSKEEALKNLKFLKAPPMVEVSNQLKANILTRDDDDDVKRRVVIACIKDYIQNPSLEYSMCNAMAIERFGIMPSQKGKLTQEEIEAVATWVYDRYENIDFK